MTNGSSQRRCESNVHTCENPRTSARLARSTTRHAGGLVWRTTPTCTSADLREPEVDGGGRGVGPALGDDLGAGVEVDPVRPVHVRVAEQRRLPAAEAVIRDRDGDGHVDAHHAGVALELELAGSAAV